MRYLFLILLTACSVTPDKFSDMTPADARAYGVNVPDNAQVTGTIVRSEFGTFGTMRRECGEGAAGCAKGVNDDWPSSNGLYEIWYAEWQCVPFHEAAHAMYETWMHTPEFVIRQFQGDRLAACP